MHSHTIPSVALPMRTIVDNSRQSY